MRTLISTQRPECSEQIASLPLSFFFLFLFFFAKATGRTVRQMWTNEGSKRVVHARKYLLWSERCDDEIFTGGTHHE